MSVTVTITIDASGSATSRLSQAGAAVTADESAPPTLEPRHADGAADEGASDAPPPADLEHLGSGTAGSPLGGQVAGEPPDDVLVAGDDAGTAAESPVDLGELGHPGSPPAGDGPGA